jgi:hypothetical protein
VKGRTIWKVRPMPSRAIRCGGSAWIGAAQQIEERGLAGAVRADHAENLAALDVEVDVAHRREPGELAGEATGR